MRQEQKQGELEGNLRDFSSSPVVKTCAFTAEGAGSITGLGTKILRATWGGQKKKTKRKKKVIRVAQIRS